MLGVGNLLLQDEGVGVHVIRALKEGLPSGNGELVLVDGGTCPDISDLLPDGIEKLIVVDAVPGTVYRFTPGDIVFGRERISSLHQLGLAESLTMMASTGPNPTEVVLIGVEPKQIAWGLEMSPELQEIVPKIIEVIKKEIDS